jgi:hypothetical protein
MSSVICGASLSTVAVESSAGSPAAAAAGGSNETIGWATLFSSTVKSALGRSVTSEPF